MSETGRQVGYMSAHHQRIIARATIRGVVKVFGSTMSLGAPTINIAGLADLVGC